MNMDKIGAKTTVLEQLLGVSLVCSPNTLVAAVMIFAINLQKR